MHTEEFNAAAIRSVSSELRLSPYAPESEDSVRLFCPVWLYRNDTVLSTMLVGKSRENKME